MDGSGLVKAGALASIEAARRVPSPAMLLRATAEAALALYAAIASAWSATDAGRAARRTSSATADRTPAEGPPAAAFREVVLPHLDAAYNLARFLTRDADAADDIVQDAFLRAFRSFDGYRGGDARAWLLAIVRNCARTWANDRLRDRARCEPLDDPAHAEERPEREAESREFCDPDALTPEAAILRNGEAAFLRRAIETLPGDFREVLVLREFEGLSYREIAEIIAAPIGTVMSRLARARTMLSAAWRHLGGEDNR